MTSGSKGDFFNIAQVTGLLGQQNITGKRIEPMISQGKRSLPHYPFAGLTKEMEYESRGFVRHSFIHGLNPQEFYFHAMSGREGVTDTAMGTSKSGYIQRRIVKCLEDMQIQYDGTVRNTSGFIYQTAYGHDGMDTKHTIKVKDDISEILSDPDMSPVLMRKLDEFYKFSNDFLEVDCKPEQHYIVAKPIEITEKKLKINLLGLNSSLFAGYDGDDKQKLAFGLYQTEQAFLNLDNAHLSIAFFHHPFSCFHDCEKPIQNQLKEKVDLIFTGHLHDPSNMSQHDSAGKVVTIGAGASYETRESENSFNVGVLDLETGQGKIQFWL